MLLGERLALFLFFAKNKCGKYKKYKPLTKWLFTDWQYERTDYVWEKEGREAGQDTYFSVSFCGNIFPHRFPQE